MITGYGANGVGRFSVQFIVANNDDLAEERHGHLAPDKVRRLTFSGLVNCGASHLVLPEALVKNLGLPYAEKMKVRYADGRSAIRNAVQNVFVEIMGRSGVFRAVVERNRQEALIGAIVLEDLDFLIDPGKQRLVPRDPDAIFSEIE